MVLSTTRNLSISCLDNTFSHRNIRSCLDNSFSPRNIRQCIFFPKKYYLKIKIKDLTRVHAVMSHFASDAKLLQ